MARPLPYAIFDMDGTLLDSMGMWDRITDELLARCEKHIGAGTRARLVALTLEDAAALLVREYGLPGPAEAVAEQARQLARHRYETQVRLKPGAAQALEALQARGVDMCVASSTEKDQIDAALRALGVLERFRFTICCPDGHGKDEPQVYLQAMRLLGAPDPGQVMVFEDSPVALATAKAAGFRVTAVRDPSNAGQWEGMQRLADAVCGSWPDWLRAQGLQTEPCKKSVGCTVF